MTPEDVARFWSKVSDPDEFGCRIWSLTPSQGDGYGYFKVAGKRRRAHIVAYELVVGPVPAGLVLDHVAARGCRSRMCCNTDHLEPVTRAENNRRARAAAPAPDTCGNGHRYDKVSPRGRRVCSTCIRDATRRYRARRATVGA